MSTSNAADPVTKSAAKKKRKNKKKASEKAKDVGDATEVNGAKDDNEGDGDDGEQDDDAEPTPERNLSVAESLSDQPVVPTPPPIESQTAPVEQLAHPSTQTQQPTVKQLADPSTQTQQPTVKQLAHPPRQRQQPSATHQESLPLRNGDHKPATSEQDTLDALEVKDEDHSDTSARLNAMAKERDELRAQVAELRKSLETISETHQEELVGLRDEVEEAQTAKESAESQYRTLLGKVNTIRSQLGERLKADAEELSQARTQIEHLQQESQTAKESNKELRASISELQAESKAQEEEVASLRSRTNLSQTNWAKERDDLTDKFKSASRAMEEWEVLAREERNLREGLSDQVAELEDQLNEQREAYERAVGDRDSQSSTVDGLQRALQEIQEARKRELRELVESSQSQLDAIRAEAEKAKSAAETSAAELERTQKELERALPFEREVKEKNLLIGKLRHEAVILNDHLTKALRFLKRGKPEDNVDRQIVTNHFLQFLMLDRSDPKKFQVLQLIAALLGWSEEQRERAGLARPGASNAALRVPLSPFRRTPSTPSLSSDFMPDGAGGGGSGSSRESLAELWSDFLEREAQEGGGGGSAAASRAASVVGHGMRSPSVTSPTSERQIAGLGIGGGKSSS